MVAFIIDQEQQFCSKINRVVIAGESLYEQPVEDEAVYKKKVTQI